MLYTSYFVVGDNDDDGHYRHQLLGLLAKIKVNICRFLVRLSIDCPCNRPGKGGTSRAFTQGDSPGALLDLGGV